MPSTLFKPAGLPVFPPHDDPGGDSLLTRLIEQEPSRRTGWPPGFEGGLAHRLDTATSGAMIVADDPEDLARVRAWFAEGLLSKRYGFEAARDVPWDENRCDRPIAHDAKHRSRMIVQRGAATPHRGQWYPARSAFRRHRGRLWTVEITTGVTHQIRVHAAFLGVPLRGDRHYGGGPPLGPVPFRLHCFGVTGPGGFTTDPVPVPDWWDSPAAEGP